MFRQSKLLTSLISLLVLAHGANKSFYRTLRDKAAQADEFER